MNGVKTMLNAQNNDRLILLGSKVTSPKLRLICFPFAGGGVSNYLKWRNDLHEEIELCGVNLPGRERLFGQPCLTNYKELISELASLIEKKTDCPLIFFGHSFGGLTAYFTALELNTSCLVNLVHLYVSARVPPHIETINRISQLSQEHFTSILSDRYQAIPQQILNDTDLLNLFIPIVQKDFEMYEQYPQVFASYADQLVNCDITSIGYSEDKNIENNFLSWKDFTKKNHQHLLFPGGHFEILKDWRAISVLINKHIA